MNQADLRLLAEERIKDAKALLDGQRWSFAYYVAGYAVECALKSCILARMIHTGLVFQEKEKSKAHNYLTHDFGDLVKLAGLTPELDNIRATTPGFVTRWGIVTMWNVVDRYKQKAQAEAEELYEAITYDPDGVLKWLRNYW